MTVPACRDGASTLAAKKPSAYRVRRLDTAQPHQTQEQLVVPPVPVQLRGEAGGSAAQPCGGRWPPTPRRSGWAARDQRPTSGSRSAGSARRARPCSPADRVAGGPDGRRRCAARRPGRDGDRPAICSSAALTWPQWSGSRPSGRSSMVIRAPGKKLAWPPARPPPSDRGVPVSTTRRNRGLGPGGEAEQRPAATDLDVVGVGSETEHLQRTSGRRQADHGATS